MCEIEGTDCGNYAQRLTPNPLLSLLDHFYRSPFYLDRDSGYECYKKPLGVEKRSRN